MAIDPEELRLAMLAVLAKQERTLAPPKDPFTASPANMDFDWDVLRLMVNAKMRKEFAGDRGIGFKPLSRIVGVADTALGSFLRGEPGVPTLKTAMRLMAWLGYSDLRDFLVDHDE
jgi:hypothetical protein